VLQNFRELAAPVQKAIRQFEKEVETSLRPDMEEAYAAAVEAGDEELAAQVGEGCSRAREGKGEQGSAGWAGGLAGGRGRAPG